MTPGDLTEAVARNEGPRPESRVVRVVADRDTTRKRRPDLPATGARDALARGPLVLGFVQASRWAPRMSRDHEDHPAARRLLA